MSYYKQKTKPNVLLNGVYVDRNGNLFLDSYVCLCKHLTVKQLPQTNNHSHNRCIAVSIVDLC